MMLGVEAVDRRGLREVERLALRNAFGDVEQHDVAEFLEADEMGERAADLAGADQCNLGTRHGNLWEKSWSHGRRDRKGAAAAPRHSPFGPAVQGRQSGGIHAGVRIA